MDIAAVSTALSQEKIQNQISVSLMRKAMDGADQQMENIQKLMDANVRMMEQSVTPHVGGNLDVRV